MNSQNLVSIVVVTYNSAKYVVETLESIRLQTYENIELIISDDCSTDDTVIICEDWLKCNQGRFVRSSILTIKENQGIPANFNKGVRKTEGEYVKIIAGDDYLDKEFVQKCVDVLEQNIDCGLVYTNSFLVLEYKQRIIKEDTSKFKSGNIFKELFFLDFWPKAPSWMYRRNVLFEMGLFDESIWVEDYLIALKIAKKYSIIQINEFLTYYRLHNENNGRDSIRLYEAQMQTIDRYKEYEYYKERRLQLLEKLSQRAMIEKPSYLLKLSLEEKELKYFFLFIRGVFRKVKRNVKKIIHNNNKSQ